MDRLTWYQPGEGSEELLCQTEHVGIYDGDLEHTVFEQGTASITLYRIIWADSSDPDRRLILHHSLVQSIEKHHKSMNSRGGEMIVRLKPASPHSVGPQRTSPFNYIRLVFRAGGDDDFHKKYEDALIRKTWQRSCSGSGTSKGVVPRLPLDYDDIAFWLKLVSSSMLTGKNIDFLKHVWRTGTAVLLFVYEDAKDFYIRLKSRRPEWFLPSGNIPEEFNVLNPKVVDEINPRLLEQGTLSYKFLAFFALVQAKHNNLLIEPTKRRISTLLVIGYKLTRDQANSLVRTIMASLDVIIQDICTGASGLSCYRDFYRHATLSFVLCRTSPVAVYLRDTIKYTAMGWHRFHAAFFLRYRFTQIMANRFYREQLEQYCERALEACPGQDLELFPYLAACDLATPDKLSPRATPLLFVCSIVYLEIYDPASPLIVQYKKSPICELSPLSFDQVKRLIARPLKFKKDRLGSGGQFTPTPIVDQLFGKLSDYDLSEEVAHADQEVDDIPMAAIKLLHRYTGYINLWDT